LGLLESFDGSCLGHALSKVCQYATTNDKMCIGLSYAFIKDVQGAIQKCITWLKKSGKGRQAWDKAYINYKLRPRKLNMLMKIR
jgi:hypothetical protein